MTATFVALALYAALVLTNVGLIIQLMRLRRALERSQEG